MNKIRDVINEWDPIGLFPCAPDDEYEIEIKNIEEELNKIKSEKLLARAIYSIFINAFGEDVFKKSLTECTVIARQLMINDLT